MFAIVFFKMAAVSDHTQESIEEDADMIPMDASIREALRKFTPEFVHVRQVRVLQSIKSSRSDVVCIEEKIVVKRGRHVMAEAEATSFVAWHTSIPVPKGHGTRVDERGRIYLVMDFVRSETLWDAWPRLSPVEREALSQTLKGFVDELRNLNLSENYIGALGRKPFVCDLLTRESRQAPFDTEHEFNDILAGRYIEDKPLSYFGSLLRKLLTEGH